MIPQTRVQGCGTVGDRADVTDLELNGPMIQAAVIAPAPAEPMSAPGQETIRRWELRSGALVEVATKVTAEQYP